MLFMFLGMHFSVFFKSMSNTSLSTFLFLKGIMGTLTGLTVYNGTICSTIWFICNLAEGVIF